MAENEDDTTGGKVKLDHAVWQRHLGGMADELVRLTAICDIDLRASGVIDKVLHGDASACGRKNEIAFRKLQRLLAATYESLNKAIGRIGAEDTKALAAEIMARVDKHRAAGGQTKGISGSPFRR